MSTQIAQECFVGTEVNSGVQLWEYSMDNPMNRSLSHRTANKDYCAGGQFVSMFSLACPHLNRPAIHSANAKHSSRTAFQKRMRDGFEVNRCFTKAFLSFSATSVGPAMFNQVIPEYLHVSQYLLAKTCGFTSQML